MLKKTIEFEDFNGNKVSQDFFFHLSKARIIELEANSGRGGLKAKLEYIQQEQDPQKILAEMKSIILMAYGKKSEDGTRFLQSEELNREFQESNAWSELLMGFFQDPQTFAEFIAGIIPHDLRQQVERMRDRPPDAPNLGPRPAVSDERMGNVFERDVIDRDLGGPPRAEMPDETASPHTESRMVPPPGALGEKPAARVLSKAEAEAMEATELQRGLIEGRYKLS